jgi:very-short-patch-repair endonuclease
MPIEKRHNSPSALQRARQLRRNMTWPENLFWSRVKAHQFMRLKFRKQHPVGPYVVDFYCAEVALVVEMDGDSHVDIKADAVRQRYLEGLGLKVVRYSNDDVLNELDWVMGDLARQLACMKIPPLPLPSREGNERC